MMGLAGRGKLEGWEREIKAVRQAKNSPPPSLIFTAEVDVDSFSKWPSHDLQAQTVCCARQADCTATESQLCVEGVLLIRLRVGLVMGGRLRQ